MVRYIYENGLFQGTGDREFSPKGTMTRGMLATVLYRMAEEPVLTAGQGAGFSDVEGGSYYAQAVRWAGQNGHMLGVGNSRFLPGAPVTREQLASVLYRYAGCPETVGDRNAFQDGDRVSGFAADALRWAVGRKIIAGKDGSRLDPRGTATRAEVAAVLYRYLI